MNKKNPIPLRDIYVRSNMIYFDETNTLDEHDMTAVVPGFPDGGGQGDIYRGVGLWIEPSFNYTWLEDGQDGQSYLDLLSSPNLK
jgi:hypothetical protein